MSQWPDPPPSPPDLEPPGAFGELAPWIIIVVCGALFWLVVYGAYRAGVHQAEQRASTSPPHPPHPPPPEPLPCTEATPPYGPPLPPVPPEVPPRPGS